MTDQRRDGLRVPILGELRGEVKVFQPLAVTEVSRDGAQIETTFPLQLDSVHELRLSLGPRSVVVRGRIAHSRIADVEDERVVYRSGVEFVELSDHARVAIGSFIDALRASRMGPLDVT